MRSSCTGTRSRWWRALASKRCQKSRTLWNASSAVISGRLLVPDFVFDRLLAACHSCTASGIGTRHTVAWISSACTIEDASAA